MALNLKKLGAMRGGGEAPPGPREKAPGLGQAAAPASWHGRASAPPPPGSSWDQYLDWASDCALEPTPDDLNLAMRLWRGIEQHDDDEQSAPRP